MPREPATDETPVYVLHVRPLPHAVPTPIRLRRMLKAMLRVYAIRCTSVVPADAPRDAPAAGGEPPDG